MLLKFNIRALCLRCLLQLYCHLHLRVLCTRVCLFLQFCFGDYLIVFECAIQLTTMMCNNESCNNRNAYIYTTRHQNYHGENPWKEKLQQERLSLFIKPQSTQMLQSCGSHGAWTVIQLLNYRRHCTSLQVCSSNFKPWYCLVMKQIHVTTNFGFIIPLKLCLTLALLVLYLGWYTV